jgi:hypothetical protein
MIVYPEELLATRVKELEADIVCLDGRLTHQANAYLDLNIESGNRISALEAENERLREVLTTIRDRKWNTMTQGCDAACDAAKIARAALVGKAEQ